MRTFQFWVLIFASTVVSGLMLKQVFLMRELNQLQRTLAESQQVVKDGSSYENAWKQLAMRMYQMGHQDPAIIDLLKKEDVEVRTSAPPAPPSTPAPSTSSKPTVAPPHPATP